LRLFNCQACSAVVYFENYACTTCGHRLAYAPEQQSMRALEPDGTAWRPIGPPEVSRFLCQNAEVNACNWLVPPGSTAPFCVACRHNGTISDLGDSDRVQAWRELEAAKRRLFYSLMRMNLPLRTREEDPDHGLTFNFLADDPARDDKVMTGHDNGVITIALAEADQIERERRRVQMGEPYRTLLGHFRHEVGHHYWDILVRDGGQLEACRAVFGNDSRDYDDALKQHYAEGPPADWQDNYVSAYAATHPWEDFAETWAHYLHIIDTLEMAANFRIEIAPAADRIGGLSARADFDPYSIQDFDQVTRSWLPFVFAMNALSRTIGLRDMYPFILSPKVINKLSFLHGLVADSRLKVRRHDKSNRTKPWANTTEERGSHLGQHRSSM
jgi:hypothetical protein